METITHNLVAVITQILCFMFFLYPWNIIFTIIFAFLSHIVFDALAFMTYHTPDKQKGDIFWIIWHIIIYGLSILSIIIFIIPFWLGLLFANIMDIWDWFILRPIQFKIKKKKPESKWGDKLYFHQIVDWVRKKFFFWLPKLIYKKSMISIEILLIIGLTVIVFFLGGFSFIV